MPMGLAVQGYNQVGALKIASLPLDLITGYDFQADKTLLKVIFWKVINEVSLGKSIKIINMVFKIKTFVENVIYLKKEIFIGYDYWVK